MDTLTVSVAGEAVSATWTDANPHTRTAVLEALPIAGDAHRWGDELYLPIEVAATPAQTQRTVPPGTVAYWPDGPALCVFWGPTPASTDDTPRAASPVAVLAELTDLSVFDDISGDVHLRFERAM